MKIDHKPTSVETNATFDRSEKMAIDPASLPHIFRVLTDIYSNPVASVVREYAANGYDSHVLAGQTRPVEVIFPTYLNASFIVRDWGVGMSREDLVNVYRMYGASTKRDTNDMIGAFGLGAKSALALTNSFTVNAVKDGKRNVVIISKDEEGGSDVNFLAEQDVDEPNGVTVTIPVPNPREFAQVQASNIFVGWKPGTVLVDGKQPASVYDAEFYKALPQASGWYEPNAKVLPRTNGHLLRAVVGPVLYNITAEVTREVLSGFSAKVPADTLAARLVLNLPNGSVAITPNREELIFNAMTKRAIIAALEVAVAEICDWAAGLLAAATTHKDAAAKADALFEQGLLPVGPVVWRGQELGVVDTQRWGGYRNFEYTYAKAESQRTVGDLERLFPSNIYWGYSNVNGHHLRSRHDHNTDPQGPRGVNRIGDRGAKFVLITEAARNHRGDFETNTKLTAWYKASGLNSATSGRGTAVNVFTTTRRADQLPAFLTALAVSVVTAADVLRIAKENAEPKVKVAKPTEPFTLAVTKVGDFREKKDMLVSVEPTSLNADVKYVIVQASGPNGEGPATFENAIYTYFRGGKGEVLPNTEKMVRAAAIKKYSFVVLPSTAKRERYEAALPNVHALDSAFAEVLAFTGTEAQQDFYHLYATNTAFASRYYGGQWETTSLVSGEQKWVSKIANEVTREFVTLAARHNTEANTIINFARFAREMLVSANTLSEVGPATKAAVKNLAALRERKNTREYVLLHNGIPAGAEADAVDYINRVDAAAGR